MKEKRLKERLNELAERAKEPVRSDLAEQIKQQIPHRLERHKIGWDTVNIIIDLRMSKSVAAAAIIITLILLANLFGGRDSTDGGIVRDSILLIKYWGGAERSEVSAVRSKYEHLLHRGEEVTWYGDRIDPKDRSAVLMQHKRRDGRYCVTFVDGRERDVSAEELVKLLTRMLQNKAK